MNVHRDAPLRIRILPDMRFTALQNQFCVFDHDSRFGAQKIQIELDVMMIIGIQAGFIAEIVFMPFGMVDASALARLNLLDRGGSIGRRQDRRRGAGGQQREPEPPEPFPRNRRYAEYANSLHETTPMENY